MALIVPASTAAIIAVAMATDGLLTIDGTILVIYGINGGSATTADATFMKGLGVSVRRWGGNNTSRVAVQRPLDRCLQPDQYVPPTLPDDTAPLTEAPERPQPQPA